MSKKRGYTFGLAYLSKLPIRYSLIHGYWCTDGYACWLINVEKKEASD